MAELFDEDPAPPAPKNGNGATSGKATGGRAAARSRPAKAEAAAPTPAAAIADPFAQDGPAGGNDVVTPAAESSSEPSGGVPLMAAPTSAAATIAPPLPPRVVEEKTGAGEPDIFAGPGLVFERRYTEAGQDVFDTVEWEMRTAAITGEHGEVVFEQKDCEIPKPWSMLATNVVVSKYFRGKVGTPGRETSVRQLVSRVSDTIWKWGKQGGYFASETDADAFHDELSYLLLHQHMAFNSPVWFNLGVKGEKPQVSACFINSVDDTMESILSLARTEGMLFKWGSGTGTNLSVLRSSREGLKGGGTASGPISFMRGFDAFAGAIKCLTPDAYVYTDRGMRTLGEVIDPNLAPGFHENESVVLATKDGPTRISHVYVSPEAETFRLTLRHTNLSLRGTADHPVLTLTPNFRLEWKRLPDLRPGDRVAVSRRTELWPAAAPSFADFAPQTKWAKKTLVYPDRMTPELARLLGYLMSEGRLDDARFRFCNADRDTFDDFLACVRSVFGTDPAANVSARVNPTTGVTTWQFEACWTNAVRFLRHVGLTNARSNAKTLPWSVRQSPRALVVEFLRAYFEGDGHVSTHVYAASASKQLLREIQLVLLNLGMVSLLRPHPVNGKDYWSLYLRGEQAWAFVREIGFVSARKKAMAEFAGDKNTNVDTVPFLVDVLRSACAGQNGYFRCADGVTRFVGFGFFNRRPAGGISYNRLRSTPNLADKVRAVNPDWADTLETILAGEFFWDAVASVETDAPAVTYDFTVPGTHSFVANGIVNHNSGGKTRRAAKMVILDAQHPDVEEFIECKADAEKKAHALIEAGYSGAFNVANGAYDSVYFQNANHSVRATDDFMRAVELGRDFSTINVLDGTPDKTFPARDLMHKIASAAWVCGDPGMQFDTTINRWHTCPNTDRIHASNPCVTGDTLVATADGWQRIDSLVGGFAPVIGADGQPHFVTNIFPTGTKPVFRLRTKSGFELRLTADHKVLTTNGDVPASQLQKGDRVLLQGAGFGRRALGANLALAVGVAVGDGCLSRSTASGNLQEIITLVMVEDEAPVLEKIASAVNEQKVALKAAGSIGRNGGVAVSDRVASVSRLSFSSQPVVALFTDLAVLDEGSDRKRFTSAVYELDRASLAGVLRGLFTADGTVANYGEKSQYVALDSTSEELLRQVQMLLLSFGVKAKIYSERRRGQSEAVLPDGRGGMRTYPVKEMHSLRISRSSRFVFEREIGFDRASPKADALAEMNWVFGAYRDTMTDEVASLEPLGEEPVYDLTEPTTSHFVANGLVVHNCSEYMFLDDSACNLASLNLMRFRTPDREFDVEAFLHAVRVTITAMEIMVGNAAYPTDKITINSHDYRPLGLGYANLGALLMARGLPYDSDEGRAYAGAITALMSGEAYHQSAKMAGRVGTFAGYEKNRQPFLRVMEMHRDHVEGIPSKEMVPPAMIEASRKVWDDALAVGRENGFRNSQISVLAPTGTIGFLMDCDTTGVEPDIAIVKYKSLVGGGMFKIVNQTVPEALERLGYSAGERKAILDYIDANDTIEGAPGIADEHLPVFDCAFRAKNGTRTIHYLGHIKMMAAVQPFLSGAISKTVNMPHDATPDDIAEAYQEAWRSGVKALAIYRDGSKKTQPLSTGTTSEQEDKGKAAVGVAAPAPEVRPFRRKLPDERHALTHKFSVGGHEGYLTIGLYPDGDPGEIFIVMSKEGSVVSGLMDSFATSISLALQYGVPLRTLVEKFMHTRFEPSGFTGNPEIPMAKSIMDYLFRYLALKFLNRDERANVGLIADQQDDYDNGGNPMESSLSDRVAVTAKPSASVGQPAPAGPAGSPAPAGQSRMTAAERQVFVTQADAPPCPECGGITTRNGACYRCNNCGTSIGCS